MKIQLKNTLTGEVRIVTLSEEKIKETMSEEIYDALGDEVCNHEPMGETNVVECNCCDYIDQFEMI